MGTKQYRAQLATFTELAQRQEATGKSSTGLPWMPTTGGR
jgi:hypothetical protein